MHNFWRTATPRRLAAASSVLAIAAATAAGTSTMATAATAGVHAASATATSQGTATRMAVTLTGAKVPVSKPVFKHTPVHPERLTHPGKDSMGVVTAAHMPHANVTANTNAAATPNATVPQLPGIDVSSHQGNLNWATIAPHIDFSYAKATEGTYYTNPDFTNQYNGPYNNGLIRGAYHFGIPNNSQGQTQADYFVAHGGGWSGDGRTLPGTLDIEYNPYGAECYGLTHAQMVTWLTNFVNEYAFREGVFPVIYSTTDWWTTCTGNSSAFGSKDPLWIANYSASGGGPLPAGWGFYTFWQYADSGSLPGDQDVFNGAFTRLQTLATNG